MSRVLVITGSRKGIGKALANHFLESGETVHGCSRQPASIEHPNYTHHCLDVADEKDVAKMMRAVAKAHGRIDGLINNAGVAAMNHLLTTPMRSAQALIETNLLGTFACLREAAKQMRKQGQGRIINFSSVAAPLALEGEALYAASKAAVETLTKVAAKELAPWGITVNAVGPGPIQTGLISGVPKARIEALIQQQAVKRLATVEDVIHAVTFFLHPDSGMVTGQILYLGGPNG